MNIGGIDYSMTTPCICTGTFSDTFEYKDFKFFFLTSKPKVTGVWLKGQIYGALHPLYNNQESRFNNISNWAIGVCKHMDFITLEGYSMGSKGQVFTIGENTGILKNKLWQNNKTFVSVAPTVIKKFATGKGNSDKEAMFNAFLKETNVDLVTIFSLKRPDSPVNDIVDSYFLAKYAWHLTKEQSANK